MATSTPAPRTFRALHLYRETPNQPSPFTLSLSPCLSRPLDACGFNQVSLPPITADALEAPTLLSAYLFSIKLPRPRTNYVNRHVIPVYQLKRYIERDRETSLLYTSAYIFMCSNHQVPYIAHTHICTNTNLLSYLTKPSYAIQKLVSNEYSKRKDRRSMLYSRLFECETRRCQPHV